MGSELQTAAEYLDELLHLQPALMLFLIIGLGYLLGNIRIGGFSFGPVAGVLFAGLFLGHFGFRITPGAQAVGFAMFIFSVGYQAGPRFFAVLRQDGLKYFSLAVVVAACGFSIAAGWAWMLSLEPGYSAGLLAGGLTSSPTLAAAQEAIRSGSVAVPPGITAEEMLTNVATGYAITYIFGLAGLITVIKLLPGWLGVDLVKAAADVQKAQSAMGDVNPVNVTTRRYRVTGPEFLELTVAELRERYWDQVTVTRLLRDGDSVRLKDDERLREGDVLEFIGPRSFFMRIGPLVGEEVPLGYRLRDAIESAQVIVSSEAVTGHTVAEVNIAQRFGLVLNRVSRMGTDLPVEPDLLIEKGDILTVVGPERQVDALGEYAGTIEREISETDMVTFAFGIAAGIVVGLFSVEVGGVSIGLGTAGGLLLSGLLIGYFRHMRPTFGRLPDAARWFLMEFGLLLFMAGVGLRAGGGIIETLLQAGPMLVLGGVIVTVVPILLGYVFGRKILKIEPVLLFGAITGAMTSGAALGVVTGAAKSSIPALGYTGTYAFANVLLMVAGSMILLI
jgi:putative transport protein